MKCTVWEYSNNVISLYGDEGGQKVLPSIIRWLSPRDVVNDMINTCDTAAWLRVIYMKVVKS